MSDDAVQNYDNHLRWLPPWHFFVLPVMGINAIVSLVLLAKAPSVGTLWSALVELARMQVPPDNPRLTIRHGLLTAEALAAAGMPDSARAVLTALAQRYPQSRGLKDALEHLH
jgi:hypothetical protein